MKTISMDFSEYAGLVNEKDEAVKILHDYQYAVRVVYGDKVADSIRTMASEIIDARDRERLVNAVRSGKF